MIIIRMMMMIRITIVMMIMIITITVRGEDPTVREDRQERSTGMPAELACACYMKNLLGWLKIP